MRKVVMSVVAVAVLALAAVAYAQTQQNTYKVQGSVTPAGKPGTKSKPVTAGVKFSYQVGESNGLQPSAIDQYKISLYGVRAVNGDKFAKCTPDQITSSGTQNGTTSCPSGALVGTGTIDNFVYADSDPSGKNGGFPCAKKLNIYNSGKGKGALFVYGDPAQCGGVGALPAFPISYVKGDGGGTALQFTVPKTVLHPIAGLSVAVRSVSSTIKKLSVTKSGKKYGYYESVKCSGKTRPIKVTFHTEAGQSTSTSASPTPKC
jgi:hypothetical protein